MTLTIVDDCCAPAAREQLAAIARNDERVRLVPLPEPQGFAYCANLALGLARSPFVIHISSAGGYVARQGWEQVCLQTMLELPACAIAGAPAYDPDAVDGRSLLRQPWFSAFREPSFARRRADQRLRQIHPGLFILRRSVFEREGGFNAAVLPSRVQVEYCYFLQGRGYDVDSIRALHAFSPGIPPELDVRLDESIVAVNGANVGAIALIEECANPEHRRCNICGWRGQTAACGAVAAFECPQCASTPRDRAALAWLTESGLSGAHPTLDVRGLGVAVRARLEANFFLRNGAAQVCIPSPVPITRSRALGLAPPTVTAD